MAARRARLGSLLAVAAALLAAPPPALAAPFDPDADLARGLDHLLWRRGPPDAQASGAVLCLGYFAATAQDEAMTWYVFPRRGEPGTPRRARATSTEGLAALARACGADVATFARVAHATCLAPQQLVALLAAPEVLALHAPDRAEKAGPGAP